MIEQLWYTWSSKGFGNISGFRVRAASPQLANSPRMSTLQTYMNYLLPQGANPVTTNSSDAPLCLAFLKDKDEQGQEKRALLNKRYTGRDELGRPGNYFAHLLAGLPVDFSVRQAIRYWKSPFWCVDDSSHPNDITLEPISQADLEARPGEQPQMTHALASLPFVIQAFLTLGDKQRVYIAGTPEDVAALIFGLSESLPASLLEKLTFSTYERDFAQSPALIVGTYWIGIEQGTSQDMLPAHYYGSENGPALAINCYSQRKSALLAHPAVEAFATYAAQHFSRPNKLMKIRQIAEQYPTVFPDAASFLGRLADFYTGRVDLAQLTEEQLLWLLQLPELADDFLPDEAMQQSLLAYIQGATAQQWRQTGEPLIEQLAQQAAAPGSALSGLRAGLARLGPKAMNQAIERIRTNRSQEAIRWIRLAYHTTPPEQMADPWLALLNALPSFGAVSFSWEVKSFLLGVWGTIARRQIPVNVSLFRSWLDVSWEQLESLFSWDLPDDWYTLSLEKLLGSPAGDPTQGALRQRNPRLEEMLLKFVRNPQQHSLALKLFQRMVGWGYEARLAVLVGILMEVRNQPSVAGAFLRLAHLTARELLSLFTGSLAPFPHDALVEMFLADPAWWEPAGKRLLQDTSALGDARIAQALTALGGHTEQRLVQSIQASQEQLVPFLANVLAEVRPPVMAADLWVGIYTKVPTPPTTLSWQARSRVLVRWKTIIQRFEQADLSAWLATNWIELGEVLRDLPDRWQQWALALLLRHPPSELPAHIGQIVDGLETLLEPLLASLLSDEHQQPFVIAFFAEVVRRRAYHQKMRMLGVLLTASSADPQVMEALLQAAQLAPEDATILAENCGAALLTPPILSPTALQWIAYYLNNLTAQDANRLAALSYQPIKQLTDYAYHRPPGGTALKDAIDHLTKRMLPEAAAALREGAKEPARFWLSLLAITLDRPQPPLEWLTLLQLADKPGEGISSDLRFYMLGRWAPFAQQITLQAIRPWLALSWKSLDALIQQTQTAGPFPVDWRDTALRMRITRQAEFLSPTEAEVVNTHFSLVAIALLTQMTKPERHEFVVAFVDKLAQAKIHLRVDVLADLLLQVAPDKTLAERLLQAARPTATQITWLRQHRLPAAQRSYQHVPSDFLAWLEEKLTTPAPERQAAPQQQPAPGQQPGVQKGVARLSRLQGSLARILPRRGKSPTRRKSKHSSSSKPQWKDLPTQTPPAGKQSPQTPQGHQHGGSVSVVPPVSTSPQQTFVVRDPRPPAPKYVPNRPPDPPSPAIESSTLLVVDWSQSAGNPKKHQKKPRWLLASIALVVLIFAIIALILLISHLHLGGS